MKSQNIGLIEAYEIVKQKKESDGKYKFDWKNLALKFKSHKTSTSKKGSRVWNRNYRSPVDRTIRILTTEPTVSSGYMVLRRLVEIHGGKPGSASRRLRIQYAAEFLRFAFKNGANRSCLPPEDLSTFIN